LYLLNYAMDSSVHVAITRTVKPGFEESFEKAIQAFFTRTAHLPGALGALLIRPFPGSSNNTYGILRSFKNKNARDAFYQSQAFSEWQQMVQPMVEGQLQQDRPPRPGGLFC